MSRVQCHSHCVPIAEQVRGKLPSAVCIRSARINLCRFENESELSTLNHQLVLALLDNGQGFNCDQSLFAALLLKRAGFSVIAEVCCFQCKRLSKMLCVIYVSSQCLTSHLNLTYHTLTSQPHNIRKYSNQCKLREG